MDTARARATLARTPGLTAEAAAALIGAAGGELTRACSARAAARVELSPAARAFLGAPDERAIDSDLAWLEETRSALLLSIDAGYPPLLKQTSAAPAALYVQGSVEALVAPALAMVGS